MNSETRPYRQTARAKAARETGNRILDAFVARLRKQWFDEIRLDDVASDAGVTVQTVIRRFGGKDGLLGAAGERLQAEIESRRLVTSADPDEVAAALARDYEDSGDLVLRILAQEDRSAELAEMLASGRLAHRRWLEAVFAPVLDGLPPKRRRSTLDALVVAGDVYVWKLVRRDLGRPPADYVSLVRLMMRASLNPERTPS